MLDIINYSRLYSIRNCFANKTNKQKPIKFILVHLIDFDRIIDEFPLPVVQSEAPLRSVKALIAIRE